MKLSIALALILWLLEDGKLDIQQLKLFLSNPSLLALTVAYWFVVALLIGSVRWAELLAGMGIRVDFFKVSVFNLIGFFFNTTMPGAVGGDIIKAVYVIRACGLDRKTNILMTILLDRVMGLAGLFSIAFLAVMFEMETMLGDPKLFGLGLVVIVIFLSILLGMSVICFPLGSNDFFSRLLSKNLVGFSFLKSSTIRFPGIERVKSRY